MSTSKETLNLYGDRLVPTQEGFGMDIAGQRADALDAMALAYLETLEEAQALDLACGGGGQALRMAAAGARVTAVDAMDYSAAMREAAGDGAMPSFVLADMRWLPVSLIARRFDVIVCQRAIHYLPFEEALAVVTVLRDLLSPRGRLYLSASGLHSELGRGYRHARVALEKRYAPLEDAMARRHAIHGSVCLYGDTDLRRLLEAAGLRVAHAFRSPFGNVKACAGRWRYLSYPMLSGL